MKLILAVVHDRDWHKVAQELVRYGYSFTQVGSTGGFLREGNVTFLVGVENSKLEQVLDIIRDQCETREQIVNAFPAAAEPLATGLTVPLKVTVGGAIVFVLDVEYFEKM
jgi:uncharacterized protein YaaQ